jgi:hypothetical protein
MINDRVDGRGQLVGVESGALSGGLRAAAGVQKTFRAYDPDQVLLISPVLGEWGPEARRQARLGPSTGRLLPRPDAPPRTLASRSRPYQRVARPRLCCGPRAHVGDRARRRLPSPFG